ncbi:hypothetical protein [Chitinophaga filiformis]|uniref:Uncharacterized protein n=1 Tax=Chitinophaga filiformis TaxID=104663 RepID=A0ABY4ICW2_CHIFI|nr:hypothetical protein [Chitinophaga filiformis]UPK72481.1 hypothetical protein MYF79_14405 [Chitinophaga filiformis]
MKQFHFIWLLCMAFTPGVYAQHSHDSLARHQTNIYLKSTAKKSALGSKKLMQENTKALDAYILKLERMQKKVALFDKQTANQLFPALIAQATAWRGQLQSVGQVPTTYFGYLDTLQGAVKYIGQQSTADQNLYQRSKQSVAALQNSLSVTEQTSNLITQGKQEIMAVLTPLGKFSAELGGLEKEVFYYRQQIEDYKTILTDPKKREEKLLSFLKARPEFQNFMARNSIFASLFNLPANYNASRSLEDLQTRTQVESILQRRIGTDAAGRQLASEQLDAGRTQFDSFKSKYASNGNVDDMPSFKPNPLKTKRFWNRLEPGGNIQFQRANYYFPTVADIVAQLAYKFHKSGTAGIGVVYKLGIGKGWEHVAFSHQGFGFRSFLDWKLRGSIYINGGIEANKPTGFHRIRELENWNGYQMSALIGLCHKVKVAAKRSATTTVLYDFLAARQIPGSQPFKIRFGYTFK